MNTENLFLQKSSIDYRFVRAVQELITEEIAHTQGEIAKELGVKNAKFSEIMNGRMHVGVDMLAILSENYLVDPDCYSLEEENEYLGHHLFYLPV